MTWSLITRRAPPADSPKRALAGADFVFHLAGVNRPQDPAEFDDRQRRLSRDALCEACCAPREPPRPSCTPRRRRRRSTIRTGAASGRAEDGCSSLRPRDRRAGARLPPDERLRQVVPPELQLRGGDVLPQHRARRASRGARTIVPLPHLRGGRDRDPAPARCPIRVRRSRWRGSGWPPGPSPRSRRRPAATRWR